MKKSIIFLFILAANIGSAQSDTVFVKYNTQELDDSITYKTDTFKFPSPMLRSILIGTTKLTYTPNQVKAMGYGIDFDKVNYTACSMKDFNESDETSILAIKKTDSTISVDCKIISNCCYSFICDIGIEEDSIINLIYYSHGSLCGCTCCFGLDYKLSINDLAEDFKKIKYVMINGNRKTRRRL